MPERRALAVVKNTLRAWRRTDCQLTAGALSFSTLFSLLPLLIIILSLARYIGQPLPDSRLMLRQISSLLSADESRPLRLWLRANLGPMGRESLVISLILMSIGTTSVFVNLQNAVGLMKEHEAGRTTGWKHIFRSRVVSLVMVIFVIFFILISLLADNAVNLFSQSLGPIKHAQFLHAVSYVTSIVLLSALFAVTFRFTTGPRLKWKASWTGGWLTSIVLTSSRTLLKFYLAYKPIGSVYGSAAWAIAIPLWIYFFWQVFLFGLHLTWEYQG